MKKIENLLLLILSYANKADNFNAATSIILGTIYLSLVIIENFYWILLNFIIKISLREFAVFS